jgi:hypothetical protein
MRSFTRLGFALAKTVLLTAAVLALVLVVCEAGARGWRLRRGSPHDSGLVARSWKEALASFATSASSTGRPPSRADDGKPRGVLHPFTGSELAHDTGTVLAHFRNGVPAGEYSVLVIGGSVACDVAVFGAAEIERALGPSLSGRTVRVLNYAHPDYKEPQQLTRLSYLLSFGYRPDAVINIDGFGEIAAAYENAVEGANPAYPSAPTWRDLVQSFRASSPTELDSMLALRRSRDDAQAFIASALRWKLYHSCLVSLAVESRLNVLRERRAELEAALDQSRARSETSTAMSRQRNGAEFAHGSNSVLEQCATNWYESSLSIQALCEARNITYLHVLQPTLHDPGSKPQSSEEQALPAVPVVSKPAIAAGYPILRARATALERNGVHFLDASRMFADVRETLYIDTCRVAPRGDEMLAQKIAAHFLEHELETNASRDPREMRAESAGQPH